MFLSTFFIIFDQEKFEISWEMFNETIIIATCLIFHGRVTSVRNVVGLIE